MTVWSIGALFTKRSKFKESRLKRLSHTLPLALAVWITFAYRRHPFIGGKLFDTSWANPLMYLAVSMTVAGCVFAIWARVHLGRYWSGIITLKEGHRLITTGPYQFVRHPIYTGWLMAITGTAVTAGNVDGFLCLAFVTLAFIIKLYREEALMMTEFGDEYRRFKQAVPAALIPFVF